MKNANLKLYLALTRGLTCRTFSFSNFWLLVATLVFPSFVANFITNEENIIIRIIDIEVKHAYVLFHAKGFF